jgi:heterodisulfide reductase subunit A-like polyferredoxin
MVKGSQRMGVYICSCGGNIDNSLDIQTLHPAANHMKTVVNVSESRK